MLHHDVIIIGGGAGGYFSAINIAEKHPDKSILILERGKEVLNKVRISGGGRCNVTHACFEPKPLSRFYPRGEKELIGPFHQFCSGDTVSWFNDHGVELKIEDDGRMFPVSDSSLSIVNCLIDHARKYGVRLMTGMRVESLLPPHGDDKFKVFAKENEFSCNRLIIATGSNPGVWKLLEGIGHQIVTPVPSLFTFIIQDKILRELPGVSVPQASVRVGGTKLTATGPLLITHKGLSGPGILKLSAWGARELNTLDYRFAIHVNWVSPLRKRDVLERIESLRLQSPAQTVEKNAQFDLPKRLWAGLCARAKVQQGKRWADLSSKEMNALGDELTNGAFHVEGKNTFKEEFVTAGGVDLKEVNMKTFESRKHAGLFFAGEVLNIDAITGGFNFQAAWTGGWIVSEHVFHD